MGERVRNYSWSQTPVGPPEQWPQSLRTTLSILLHSKFPMFLFWGEQLTCFYNDAFRPSLGNSGKHPTALGQPGEQVWSEIWTDIKPVIDQVLSGGGANWSEDQLLPIYRNGAIEDTYWTYSYSPVSDETGKPAGVFVTCTETTDKIKNLKRLQESERVLRTFVLKSPAAMAILKGKNYVVELVNQRALQLWGRTEEEVTGRPILESMPELKEQGIKELLDSVYDTGIAFSADELPVQIERNGQLEMTYINFVYEAIYDPEGQTNGIMTVGVDVTDQVMARKKVEESEQQVRSLVESAPFPIGVYTGKEMRIQFANEAIIDVFGKGPDVVGKLYTEILPELDNQDIFRQLDQVFTKGIPYHAQNQRVDIVTDGLLHPYYFNYSFTPLFNAAGEVYGVMNTAADVTALNLAKQSLEESERNLHNIILQAPVAMCIFKGPSFVLEIANSRMFELWGRDPSQLLRRPIFEGLPEARDQGFEELLTKVYATGETVSAYGVPVTLFRSGQLENLYVNFVYEAFREMDGIISGVMAVAVEVTEQVLARKKIEEEKERANLAVGVAGLGVFELDLSTNEMAADARLQEIFGFDTPVPRSEYVSAIHPDDRAVRANANNVIQQQGWFDYETRIIPKDKPLRWARIKGKLLYNDKGEPVKVLGVAQDITEQKEFARTLETQVQERTRELEQAQKALLHANSYLQRILNNFDTAFALLTPVFEGDTIIDFRFRMTNVAYSAYSGLSPVDIQDKKVGDVFPGYYQTDAFRRYVETYTTGNSHNWELHYNLDGLNVFLQVSATKMDDEVWVHFTDFTRLKSLQLELLRKVEELERSNQNLEEFAYAASHDLKEPIRKIHFFGDRLKVSLGNRVTPEEKHSLERVENASRRMGTLIDDLLSYSQVSFRATAFDEVDMNRLIDIVLQDLDLEIEEKKAVIKTDHLFTMPGHPRQLQQAFHNLIGNALKYSKPGTAPSIHISCHKIIGSDTGLKLSPAEQLKEFYVIQVSDNGIGFSQQDAGRIFNIFTRLHGSSEYAGTGIGLSIVRKIVENHNGFITADSEVGEGARFNVFFPVG